MPVHRSPTRTQNPLGCGLLLCMPKKRSKRVLPPTNIPEHTGLPFRCRGASIAESDLPRGFDGTSVENTQREQQQRPPAIHGLNLVASTPIQEFAALTTSDKQRTTSTSTDHDEEVLKAIQATETQLSAATTPLPMASAFHSWSGRLLPPRHLEKLFEVSGEAPSEAPYDPPMKDTPGRRD